MNLRSKGMDVLATCLQCGAHHENSWHVFFDCEFGISCWRRAQLWTIIEPILLQVESFAEVFFTILSSFDSNVRCSFVMIVWSIWKRRNDKLWSNTKTPLSQVIYVAKELLFDWLQAREFNPKTESANCDTAVLA